MLDVFNIPYSQQTTQIFYAASGSNTWQTWQKPRNAKMVAITCVGAGGGGGTGKFFLNFAQSTNGGSGGGGGVVTSTLIPSFLLPDTLYIQAGAGGRGGLGSSGAGGIGGTSYVSVGPTTLAAALVCVAPGGGAGRAGVGNNPVNTTNAAAQTTTEAVQLALGIFSSTAGTPGGTGPVLGDGGSVTALATSVTCGGSGGGGASSTTPGNAGSVISASVYLTTPLPGPLVASGPTKPSRSANGYGIMLPIYCGVGGVGSAANNSGPTADAGDGYYGCGGGGSGGASGASNYSIGNGGSGGSGLVIITVIT